MNKQELQLKDMVIDFLGYICYTKHKLKSDVNADIAKSFNTIYMHSMGNKDFTKDDYKEATEFLVYVIEKGVHKLNRNHKTFLSIRLKEYKDEIVALQSHQTPLRVGSCGAGMKS